jgi:hypothetical protein
LIDLAVRLVDAHLHSRWNGEPLCTLCHLRWGRLLAPLTLKLGPASSDAAPFLSALRGTGSRLPRSAE